MLQSVHIAGGVPDPETCGCDQLENMKFKPLGKGAIFFVDLCAGLDQCERMDSLSLHSLNNTVRNMNAL